MDWLWPGIYKQHIDEFPATGNREIETKRLEPVARASHIKTVCTASSAAASSASAALRAAVPSNMGSAGIPIPDMNVDRVGGDGGLVLPKS